MASTTLGEFAIDIIVDAGKGELTLGNLITKMGSLEVASVGEVAVLFRLAQALNDIVDGAIETALSIHQISLATGMSTKNLQEWESAATHTKAGVEGLDAAMLHASQQIWKQRHGRPSDLLQLKTDFPTLDITGLKEDAPEVLYARLRKVIAEAHYSKAQQAEKFNRLAEAGYSGIAELLMVSKTDFDAWKKERIPQTDEEIKRYEKLHDQFVTIKNLSWDIKEIIANWFTLGLEGMLGGVGTQLRAEKDLLSKIHDTSPLKPGETRESRRAEAFKALGIFEDQILNMLAPGFGSLNQLIHKATDPSTASPVPSPVTHTTHAPVINQTLNVPSGKPHEVKKVAMEALVDALQIAAANINPRGVTA